LEIRITWATDGVSRRKRGVFAVAEYRKVDLAAILYADAIIGEM